MTSTCKEILITGNRKGEECGKAAKEYVEGHSTPVCGQHKNVLTKRLSDKAPKSAAAKSGESVNDIVLALEGTAYKISKEKKKYTTSLDNIVSIVRLTESDPEMPLSDHDKNQIFALEEEEQSAMEIIMKVATSNSSCTTTKLDYRSIACKIPEAYRGYQIARLVKENDRLITTSIPLIPDRLSAKKRSIEHEKMDEKTNYIKNYDYYGLIQLLFKDVNIGIANCRFVNMSEWSKNPNNVYMGPSFDIDYVDNEWFIPLDYQKFPSREIQNKHDVQRILDNIKEGREKSDKYTSLVGKTLGCLCMPNICHCEVYIQVVRSLK